MTYNSKIVAFLSNENTIKISGIKDFKSFNSLMKKVGLNLFKNEEEAFWECVEKFKLPGTAFSFLVEYNNAKGLCMGWKTEEESEQWFEKKPFTIKEILEEIKVTL